MHLGVYDMKNSRNYYLLCFISFLQGAVFYGPISTLYRQSRGISIYEIFLIESIFMVLMILFEIPWGRFADKIGYKRTLIIAYTINFISKIVFFFAYSFEAFLLERVLLAMAISGESGCDSAMLYNSVDKEISEKAFGRYYSASRLGFFLATLSSGIIISISMDLATLATIIPYGLSIIVALFLKEVKAADSEKHSIIGSFQLIIANKGIIVFIISIALLSEVAHSVTVFLNQLQYQRVGVGVQYYGIILACMQVLSMLGAKSYSVTGRIGQGKTLTVVFSTIILGCTMLIFTNSAMVSVLMIGLITAANALMNPISADIQSKSIHTANRATMLSAYAMVMDLTAAGVNLAIGKTADTSIQLSFGICAAIAGIALILNVYYFRRSISYKLADKSEVI
jgi:MFS family permease